MSNSIEDLTSWEMIQAEKVAGVSAMQLEQGGPGTTALLVAFAWQFERRLNPKLTFEEYARNHTLAEVTEALGLETDEEVTE